MTQQAHGLAEAADALATLVRQLADEMDDVIELRGTDALHGRLVKLAAEAERFAGRVFDHLHPREVAA